MDRLKYRTREAGTLRSGDVGETVTLAGWTHTRRDHGGLIFVDLRDRSGVVQVVFDPHEAPAAHQAAKGVRSEFVLSITGRVAARPEGTENPHLPTGEVEVRAEQVEVLNAAKTPPFQIGAVAEADEGVRMRFRYLDLRTDRMQRNLQVRHRMAAATRQYLDSQGFWEVETPLLIKSTPEGARDFLVPSRLQPGQCYALPQSPQLYKQVLMVSGVERYYQLAKCLRDEDLRADRQLEFTQIDLEMSFVGQEDVIALSEGLAKHIFAAVGITVHTPFPRLTFAEAMARYGSDKPDTRFGLELADLTGALGECEFKVFASVIGGGGVVKAITVPGAADWSRSQLDEVAALATSYGAKGLVWLAVEEAGLRSPIAKFLSQAEQEAILRLAAAGAGDLVLVVADQAETAGAVLGRLRLALGRRLGLIPEGQFNFLWVTDFPLFVYNEDEQRIEPMHHPFSSPFPEDLGLLASEPLKVRGMLYDLVLNGHEVAGGSIRIHRRDIQEQVFGLIQLTPEQAQGRFGFLLEAFEYGTPPHGGIAFGFDRLVALVAGEESIREVIAFPKNAAGVDPMSGAPTGVDEQQLKELGLRLRGPKG